MRPRSPSQLRSFRVAGQIVLAQVQNVWRRAGRAGRESCYSRIPVSSSEALEKRIVLLGLAVDDATGDVEFFGDERLQTESSVVNAAARRFIAIETGQTRCGRVQVDSRSNSEIDHAVVAKAPESLQERKIQRAEFAVGADAEIVSAGSKLRQEDEFISAGVIVRECWSTVTFR